jgi:hypothetical protein
MIRSGIGEFQPLDRTLRNKLERTVTEARDVAETAARSAVEQLSVGEAKPYSDLSSEAKELRRKLRAHGRQLGDSRNRVTDVQETGQLIEEIAYEHWHRMLFARFLAENNLLMYPDPNDPVPVSLDECEDLAAEEGAENGWDLAGRFASRMLPQIFRPQSSALEVSLPPEHQQHLERLLGELESPVFKAGDSLGWVYQFWQSRKKDEVNASEVKIGAREVSAVTQLFTEHYMVSFLLDNSLGAWWAARRLTPADLRNAKSEEELRTKASLPGLPLNYLRFVKQDSGAWALASGAFAEWPRSLTEIRLLDPCCGSGHFLVAAFLMLVAMRMEDQRLSVHEATDAVLRDNLYGLEIDQRCTEIAAFNLALTAWRVTGYRPLPTPHIACTGLAVGGTREEWMDILSGQTVNYTVRFFFGQLYDLFSKAPALGSLINPHRFLGSGWLLEKDRVDLDRALSLAMASESRSVTERSELGITAQGVAKAAELLAGRYTVVATNVPYLGRGKQDEVIKDYLETNYPLGRADIATAFVLRCLEFCARDGAVALVTPQNWLFLTTYKRLRQMLLETRSWNWVVRLGSGAFETISGQVVNVAMSMISAVSPQDDHLMDGIDAAVAAKSEEKAAILRGEMRSEIAFVRQSDQLNNPDQVISFEQITGELLSRYAFSTQGLKTGDDEYWRRLFWEVRPHAPRWRFLQSSIDKTQFYGGRESVIDWSTRGEGMARLQGMQAWGKPGIAVKLMGVIPSMMYTGEVFDSNIAPITPRDASLLPAIWCFCEGGEFAKSVRRINQKLNIAEGSVVKVPFDVAHWAKVAAAKYPSGLPDPESDNPTQWLFHGHPKESTVPLQVATCRLLGYRWPPELDEKMQVSQRSRKLITRCDELLSFADSDGIVCIPSVRGESSAVDRLLNLLAKAFGIGWTTDTLAGLLNDASFMGRSLEAWLRDGFFSQHCDLFQQRPFVWQVWDGLRDGFSALLNYHKLDHKNLETLIYTYLGDWIRRQKDEIGAGVDGSQERLAAAEALKKRLELILEGDAPHDIFIRWKSIQKQPIGWDPDINDGIRTNIRPFLSVADVRGKGAGVLRARPNIRWEKDRGKEPKRPVREYPWFWGWDGTTDFDGGHAFTGDRVNDCHYTLKYKRRARQLGHKNEKET